MEVLKHILDDLNDSLIVLDSKGVIVLCNQEATRVHNSIFGKPIRTGDRFAEILTPERNEAVSHLLKTICREKKTVRDFVEYSAVAGNKVYLEVSFVPIVQAGEVANICVITQDVTARKVIESRVTAVSTDVRNLIENANAVIMSVDSRGYIIEWNNHCSLVTGFAKDEVYARRMSDVLVMEYNTPLVDDLMSATLNKRSIDSYELPIRTKDGKEVILMLSATPRTNSYGEVIGATFVGQDITELTEYRRSLEILVQKRTAELQQVLEKEKEVVDMKSRFVSIASHEFRSPLSSIDYATNFIKQHAGTIGSQILNEKVEVIEKHVHYMNHLLNDVLTYSKNEAGNIELIRSTISLDDFFMSVVEEVGYNTKHTHKINISANQMGTLTTDEKLLRNILINLLTNAIKFSPGQKEVFLMIQDMDSHIAVIVRDLGMGIPEDEMDKIFEPFVRGKAVESIQGTGLGLSIVKKAVELLHGTIQAVSTPQQGSVFTVTIPRMETM